MYQRYASSQGWQAKLISSTEADAGGYKEAVLEVRIACVQARIWKEQ
jgi:peptide chain release factor 1